MKTYFICRRYSSPLATRLLWHVIIDNINSKKMAKKLLQDYVANSKYDESDLFIAMVKD